MKRLVVHRQSFFNVENDVTDALKLPAGINEGIY